MFLEQSGGCPSFTLRKTELVVTHRVIYFALFILLFFLSAFRHESGADFNNYRNIYESVASGNDHWGATEPGFRAVLELLSFFSLGYQSFFIFSSFFIIYFVFRSCKIYSPLPIFSVFVFFLMYFYIDSFNIVRQMMAVSIIIAFAPRFIVYGHIFRFLFLILLASSFHYYAIIFLLALVLGKRDWGQWVYFLIIFVSILIFFKGAIFVNYPLYYLGLDGYVDYKHGAGGAKGFYLVVLVVLFCLSAFKKCFRSVVYFPFFINLMALSLLFIAFAEHNVLFFRVSLYFSTFLILVAPLIVQKTKGGVGKLMVGTSMLTLMTGYFIHRIANNGAEVFPYNFNFSL